MNILFFTSSYPIKSQGSWGPFIRECALSIAGGGHQVYVLVFSDKNKYEEYQETDNIKVMTYPYLPLGGGSLHVGPGLIPSLKRSLLAKLEFPPYLISSLYYLIKTIKKYEIDIIHAQWYLPAGLIAAIGKKIINKPLIVTGLGAEFYLPNNIAICSLLKYVFNAADKNVVVSNFLKLKNAEYGLKKDDILVIPNTVRTDVFYPQDKMRENNNIVIGLAKRLVPEKNIKDLLYAVTRLSDNLKSKIIVQIAGDGPEKENLIDLSRKLNIKDKVVFLGDKPHSQMPDILRSWDIYVDPSTQEGIATSNLEAMSSGLAIIAARGFGNEDAIEEEQNGLFFKPRDIEDLSKKLTQLIKNNQVRNRYAQEARRTIEDKFSSKIVGRKYKNLYDELIREMK
jgi:glycosyltransferase involved in cell wall biosynthesis